MSLSSSSLNTLLVDFSQPSRVVRDILCRRYGCRYHASYGLIYEDIQLSLDKSLHNQGVLEQEKLMLKVVEEVENFPLSPIRAQLYRKDSESSIMEVSVCVFFTSEM